jgi:hypothetical protein
VVSTRSEHEGLLTQLSKPPGQRRNRAATEPQPARLRTPRSSSSPFATYSNMSRDFRLPAILDKVRRAACALPVCCPARLEQRCAPVGRWITATRITATWRAPTWRMSWRRCGAPSDSSGRLAPVPAPATIPAPTSPAGARTLHFACASDAAVAGYGPRTRSTARSTKSTGCASTWSS